MEKITKYLSLIIALSCTHQKNISAKWDLVQRGDHDSLAVDTDIRRTQIRGDRGGVISFTNTTNNYISLWAYKKWPWPVGDTETAHIIVPPKETTPLIQYDSYGPYYIDCYYDYAGNVRANCSEIIGVWAENGNITCGLGMPKDSENILRMNCNGPDERCCT